MTDALDPTIEERLRKLETGGRDRHGLPLVTPLPIQEFPLSDSAKVWLAHSQIRREESIAGRKAEEERLEREAAEKARPRTLIELRAELMDIEKELDWVEKSPSLQPMVRGKRRRAGAEVISLAGEASSLSWQTKEDQRRAVRVAAARSEVLRSRREQVTAAIRAEEEWIAGEPARRRAAGDLPKARKVLTDIASEFEVVNGEYMQAVGEVRRLEGILTRPKETTT